MSFPKGDLVLIFSSQEIAMTSTFTKLICRFLAVAVITLPFQTGQASMIGVDQVTAPTSSLATLQTERSTIVNFLNRSQTVNEMRTLGLDAQTAVDRVAAMTDEEISTLSGKIATAPAGGELVTLVLVVFIIWYFAFRR